MKKFLLLSLLALTATVHAQGQATPPPGQPPPPGATSNVTNRPIFRATLPGGTYEVAISAMIAVASHEYMVDGIARVTEVNVDTAGSMLVRFYYIEPTQPNNPTSVGTGTAEKMQQLFQEAADRTGQDVWKKVVKTYPTTTHARTVEYRVTSKDQLTKIYNGAEEAFRLGKTVMVKVE